jgi:uroporphyrinogen decarboxylase
MLPHAPWKPDFQLLSDHLAHRRLSPRPHLAELFFDEPIRAALAERAGIQRANPADALAVAQRDSALAAHLGYDLVRIHLPAAEFTMDYVPVGMSTAESATRRTDQGYLVHETAGPIRGWEDIDRYPWPRIGALDTRPLEWADRHLPEGMKCFDLTMQVFECSSWLLGYETLFLAIHEEPDFLAAVLERIGRTYIDYTRLLCQFESVGVIWGTDDMGFKTGTMAAPAWLREHILPWHREAARIAHEAGKKYFLHSCGRIDALMPDLVNDVRIDAKHSFEDAVVPVEQFHAQWGDRIGVVGGVDVDFLSRATPEAVTARCTALLDALRPRGGHALGSGNSITSYIPLENYLAMVGAAHRQA